MTAVPRRVLAILFSSCVLSSAFVGTADAATTPSPATGVRVSATASTATISWKPAAGAASYRVCLQEYADQSPCARLSSRSTATSVTFRSLAPTSGTDFYVVVYSYRGTARAATVRQGFNLASAAPSAPTGVVNTVSTRSVKTTWDAATDAKDYDVCLTTSRDATSCVQRSRRSATRTATFSGLVPTGSTDYYVRVYAHNASGSTGSALHGFNLPVGTIASSTMVRETGTSKVRARWASGVNAEQYELQFGTNPSMTTGLKSYIVTNPSATLTRLTLGTTFHYRVRGLNGVVKGTWTAPTKFRMASDPTNVVVATYNLCGQDKCVSKSNGMKKWSTRKAYAGRIARSTGAGIIATQESHDKDTRFGTELPGYALGEYYSAKSLFYSTAKYEKLRSGIITLNSTERKYAVWVQLRDRTTRTMFLVVDAHLQPYKGRTKDRMREAQTKKLISDLARANPNKYPVIYAGDFNSNKSNADQSRYPGGYDAPLKVFTAAGIPDAFDVGRTKVNAAWNSANQAINPPLRHSDHVDHIFVDRAIKVVQFKVIVSLSGSSYAKPFATDHNPVRATVVVPGH
jgi:endonuclease/exonuclease/phosphatase family metal-dependent hydrolase